jgi:hypothetical protein
MIKHYTLENKPNFKDGDIVKVDMAKMGMDMDIMEGKIVGKSISHILDMWLVEFDMQFIPTYPYKVVAIMHTAIIDEK